MYKSVYEPLYFFKHPLKIFNFKKLRHFYKHFTITITIIDNLQLGLIFNNKKNLLYKKGEEKIF